VPQRARDGLSQRGEITGFQIGGVELLIQLGDQVAISNVADEQKQTIGHLV